MLAAAHPQPRSLEGARFAGVAGGADAKIQLAVWPKPDDLCPAHMCEGRWTRRIAITKYSLLCGRKLMTFSLHRVAGAGALGRQHVWQAASVCCAALRPQPCFVLSNTFLLCPRNPTVPIHQGPAVPRTRAPMPWAGLRAQSSSLTAWLSGGSAQTSLHCPVERCGSSCRRPCCRCRASPCARPRR